MITDTPEVTADNLTDEQAREVYEACGDGYESAAIVLGIRSVTIADYKRARARCAYAINARAKAGKP